MAPFCNRLSSRGANRHPRFEGGGALFVGQWAPTILILGLYIKAAWIRPVSRLGDNDYSGVGEFIELNNLTFSASARCYMHLNKLSTAFHRTYDQTGGL